MPQILPSTWTRRQSPHSPPDCVQYLAGDGECLGKTASSRWYVPSYSSALLVWWRRVTC
jgi:hypothetical protein